VTYKEYGTNFLYLSLSVELSVMVIVVFTNAVEYIMLSTMISKLLAGI
jgi:hypothetical protein